jgi:hypothetical protein
VRDAIRARHYSRRTEEAYVHWIRRYIVFHKKVHPSTLGAPEIGISHLARGSPTCERVDTEPGAQREVTAILNQLSGTLKLVIVLLYGAGL